MTPDKGCIELIKLFEGCRLNAYQCPAGVWTIGYGDTWHRDENRPVREGDRITRTAAADWLRKEVERVGSIVESMAPVHTQGQLNALVSFAYNLGCSRLGLSTLLRFHRAGDYAAAAEEFKKWNKAGRKVLLGLSRRRECERQMYVTGVCNP